MFLIPSLSCLEKTCQWICGTVYHATSHSLIRTLNFDRQFFSKRVRTYKIVSQKSRRCSRDMSVKDFTWCFGVTKIASDFFICIRFRSIWQCSVLWINNWWSGLQKGQWESCMLYIYLKHYLQIKSFYNFSHFEMIWIKIFWI